MIKLSNLNKEGLILCARYAASPNFFGYCGPEKSSNIIDHLKENIADKELQNIISEFETLYPYLELIARENGIEDPFSKHVVEAYWIGNPLLNNVKNSVYLAFLKEKLFLEKKTDHHSFYKIKTKVMTDSFLPHHTYHVFNIFKSRARDINKQIVKVMDECRINYGQIIKVIRGKTSVTVIVKTKPLIMVNKKLLLDNQKLKEIKIDYKGKGFVKGLKKDDFISFHWGMLSDLINVNQAKHLNLYTAKAIEYFNKD